MNALVYRMKDLENQPEKLGSDSDCADFRQELAKQLTDFQEQITALTRRIDDFSARNVAYTEEKMRSDKVDAFSNSLQELQNKLRALSDEIRNKQQLYFEAGSRRRPSLKNSRVDLESANVQHPGYVSAQQQVLTDYDKDQVKLQNEAIF